MILGTMMFSQLQERHCSVMFQNAYRYYANHTYTNEYYLRTDFATESSTFGPNQSSYSRAASALTDIVSVGVIVEPHFILS